MYNGNSCAGCLFGSVNGEIDRQPLYPWHGRHRLPAVPAVDNKDWPNEIGGRERGLSDKPSRPFVLP